MSDENKAHTIHITRSTLAKLLTGRPVLMVKIRGVDVSVQFDDLVLRDLGVLGKHAFKALNHTGALDQFMESIANGALELAEDGEEQKPGATLARVLAVLVGDITEGSGFSVGDLPSTDKSKLN